jgi:UDP-N-acetylglucosamine acyltransferase
MIGGMTGVLSDVIPYGLSFGNRNSLSGLNLIGLRRSNVSNNDIKTIKNAYEIIFSSDTFRKNIDKLDNASKENKYVKKIINFINADKKRPISIPSNIK